MPYTPEELKRLVDATCGNELERFAVLDEEDLRYLRRMVEGTVVVSRGAQQNALTLLGRAGDREADSLIINRLADYDERERINAADVLGRLATRDSIAAVADMINDPSPDVRRFAISALGRAGGDLARERLTQAATEESVSFVRRKAEQVLQELGER
jgi:HEAT repeat protein